ncbi:hypothetical protein ACFLWZ_03425 [Chloroflexota bacterium]
MNANMPVLSGLPTDHLGALANAIIIGVVIHKYKLLDISFIARRALAYSILTIFIITVFVGGLYLEIKYVPNVSNLAVILTTASLSLLLFSVVGPIRYIIVDNIDRIFQHNTYSYRQAVIEFNLKITNAIELDEVANETLRTLGKTLRLTHAELLLRDHSDFVTQFSYPQAKVAANDILKMN